MDSEQDGVGYRVTIGKEKLTEHNAGLIVGPWSEREVFSITPVVAGAGQGAGQIFAGIGLIALALINPFGAAAIGTFGLTTPIAVTTLLPAVGAIGASLVLSGVAQALSPAPINSTAAVNTYERGRDAAKFESFTFSGIVNTEKQGLPVPIIYGRCFTGSSVISVGIDVDQLI